jgi:hypothetical protein
VFTLDNLFLLLTGLLAIYLIWRFYTRYSTGKALHDTYYLLGFIVLLVSGLLLIFMGYGILGLGGTALSPFILPVASLIPLGISLGIANQFFPSWKKAFAWFALVGFLAIAVTSIGGMAGIKKFAVPIFHGVAGFVIFLGPFLAKDAPKGFFWVGIGPYHHRGTPIRHLHQRSGFHHPGPAALPDDFGLHLGIHTGSQRVVPLNLSQEKALAPLKASAFL